LFASAREAAGCARDVVPGTTVSEVIAEANRRFGSDFERVLNSCKIWVNGEVADLATAVNDNDEVAILPPVSGGDA
jgi:molybdopterin synthase sulfur carrier subunit